MGLAIIPVKGHALEARLPAKTLVGDPWARRGNEAQKLLSPTSRDGLECRARPPPSSSADGTWESPPLPPLASSRRHAPWVTTSPLDDAEAEDRGCRSSVSSPTPSRPTTTA